MFRATRRVRSAAAIGAAAALAVSLAACTSDAGGVEDTEADKGLPVAGVNVTYDPNTLVNDGKPIELEWWAWSHIEQFQAIADAYNEIHPNVTIKVVNQPWEDYWTKLPLELQSDGGPAIFNVHNSQHDNLIAKMEPYDIDAPDLEADYTGAAAHIIDGETYYIDLGLMSGAIYYNTDMWESAGLTEADIPTTWDEFREVAKKLTIREGDELRQAGFNFNGGGQAMQMGMAYQLGQNLFAEDGTTPTVDNEANLEVINRFLDIYADGSGDANFGASGTESFGQGLSAMTYAWGWYSGTLANDYPDLPWSAFRTPVPDAAETPYAFDRYNGESTFGINANASDAEKEVAQDFLRYYLTDEESMKELSLAFSIFPAYKPIADDPAFAENPALAAFDDIERYIWPGPVPATFETSTATMWEEILFNGVAPEDALATAQQSIEKDLDGTGFTAAESLYAFYAAD